MEKMNKYTTPTIEIIELDLENALLAGSPTGESFDNQDSYDGGWA